MAAQDTGIVAWLTLVASSIAAVGGVVGTLWASRSQRRTLLEQQRREWIRESLEELLQAAQELDAATAARSQEPGSNRSENEIRESFWQAYGAFVAAYKRVAVRAPKAIRNAAGHFSNASISLFQGSLDLETTNEFMKRHDHLDQLIRQELGTD